MNANDLIEALSSLDEEQRKKKVIVEGCDCYRSASGVVALFGTTIAIESDDSDYDEED